MIPATVKALQEEIDRLLVKVDVLEAKCQRQEELLRKALTWCPRKPAYGDVNGSMCDLGNEIEAELDRKAEET